MPESKRISNLYNSIYNGSPWIDINIIDTLKSVNAEQAFKKVTPEMNSIWEITNHIIEWRKNVLQRVQGKVLTTPEHNYFTTITDSSEEAWQKTLQNIEKTQELWNVFLTNFEEADFEKIYLNNLTFYEHIHGIIQHDVYHLGQIVILKKLI